MSDTNEPTSDNVAQGPRQFFETPAGGARRRLLVMRAGEHALALRAEETDGEAPYTNAAPLPFAPPAILGVVAARGRMRTVIDPSAFLTQPADGNEQPQRIVLLKGDEQLALAVSHVGTLIEVEDASIRPATHDFARGLVTHDGQNLLIINPSKLFDAATRGMERRRRRR